MNTGWPGIYCLRLSPNGQIVLAIRRQNFAQMQGWLLTGGASHWLERVHGRTDFQLDNDGPTGYEGSLEVVQSGALVTVKSVEGFWARRPGLASMSLYVLFEGLTNQLLDVSDGFELLHDQPVVVQMDSLPGKGRWLLSAFFSKEVKEWYLGRFAGEETIPEATEAMQIAHRRLNDGKKSECYHAMRASCGGNGNGPCLYIADGGCTFGSDSWPDSANSAMGCRHIYTSGHQLTALTGVAAIANLFYSERYPE